MAVLKKCLLNHLWVRSEEAQSWWCASFHKRENTETPQVKLHFPKASLQNADSAALLIHLQQSQSETPPADLRDLLKKATAHIIFNCQTWKLQHSKSWFVNRKAANRFNHIPRYKQERQYFIWGIDCAELKPHLGYYSCKLALISSFGLGGVQHFLVLSGRLQSKAGLDATCNMYTDDCI